MENIDPGLVSSSVLSLKVYNIQLILSTEVLLVKQFLVVHQGRHCPASKKSSIQGRLGHLDLAVLRELYEYFDVNLRVLLLALSLLVDYHILNLKTEINYKLLSL